uniref:Small ribosomal subunit protein uS17c n=1 Tax=Hildenbrandia rubra TaxID=31481 RepID=A0A1C9CGC9_9FLOR|nr:ribosomal protein S17 [Hildenbrandia rubra]AOM67425.1 ribosomal protein S17 [Hildenbrandia rubra]
MPLKKKTGLVVSDKMDKTIVVAVKRQSFHKKYRKTISITKKYKAHDERNKCKVGDIVKIQETRPLSKTKCWAVIDSEK